MDPGPRQARGAIRWALLSMGLALVVVGTLLVALGVGMEQIGGYPSVGGVSIWIVFLDGGALALGVGASVCALSTARAVRRRPMARGRQAPPPATRRPTVNSAPSSAARRPASAPGALTRAVVASAGITAVSPGLSTATVSSSAAFGSGVPGAADHPPPLVRPAGSVLTSSPGAPAPAPGVGHPPMVGIEDPPPLPAGPTSRSVSAPIPTRASSVPEGVPACTDCRAVLTAREAWRKCPGCGGTICGNCLVNNIRVSGAARCSECVRQGS
ncbi:MAG TPA: hypothetical protein VGV89_08290 [Thermoplasmata archaeon]|nr:hypothetical protein [Thermoplasmata archaeon]